MQRLDVYTSLREQRADRVYMISNGKNTIYILDYVVKVRKVYHDPLIYIVGVDAQKIAQTALNNLTNLLLSKTFKLSLDEEVIEEFSNLRGISKTAVIKETEAVFEEAELALKMKLLERSKSGEKMSNKSEKKRLSSILLEDVKKQEMHLPLQEVNFDNTVIYGALTIIAIFFLVLILTRL